jgi:GINS complex subunit 3
MLSSISFELPSSLSPHVLNALKADPRTVELRALAPHFYALGAHMIEQFGHDELLDVLSESYGRRAREIADMAGGKGGSGVGREGGEFLRGLDEDERACEFAVFFLIEIEGC